MANTTDHPARFAATVEAARNGIIVPRAIRVRDGELEWSREAPGWNGTLSLAEYERAGTSHYTRGQSDIEVLDRFSKLYQASDTHIEAFARHFGVLYVSSRGVPNSEMETLEAVEYPSETFTGINLVRNANGEGSHLAESVDRPVRWHKEPLNLWRDWSLLVRLLWLYGLELRSTAERIDPEVCLLHRDIELSPASDVNERWFMSEPISLVYQLSYTSVGREQHRLTTADEQRTNLGGWLDILTSHAKMTMRLDWTGTDGLQARIGRSRSENMSWLTNTPACVFGDVMLQLVNTLLWDGQSRICLRCKEPFEPEGKEQRCNHCRTRRLQERTKNNWRANKDQYNRARRERAAEGRRRPPNLTPV